MGGLHLRDRGSTLPRAGPKRTTVPASNPPPSLPLGTQPLQIPLGLLFCLPTSAPSSTLPLPPPLPSPYLVPAFTVEAALDADRTVDGAPYDDNLAGLT